MPGLLPALVAAALYVLAFPPVDVGPLAFLALAPWCLVVRRWRGARLFGAGALIGAAILAFGCGWIRATAWINLLLMIVPESLFFGLFALLLRALHVTRRWPAIVALPVAFTSVEFLRGHFPLDGFPWLTLGYSQHAALAIVQLSRSRAWRA
jgi:apolipoprotein N-acyltransferase